MKAGGSRFLKVPGAVRKCPIRPCHPSAVIMWKVHEVVTDFVDVEGGNISPILKFVIAHK